jgi:hypothetical protein
LILRLLEVSSEKFKKIKGAIKRKIFNLRDTSDNVSSSEGGMTAQLKGTYHMTGRKSQKIQILTILPKNSSIWKIQQQFKASNYMAQTAKKLVAEKRILSSPNVKPGKVVPLAIAEMVK